MDLPSEPKQKVDKLSLISLGQLETKFWPFTHRTKILDSLTLLRTKMLPYLEFAFLRLFHNLSNPVLFTKRQMHYFHVFHCKTTILDIIYLIQFMQRPVAQDYISV